MAKVDYQTERELRKLRKQTADGGSSAWGELTGVLSDQTDLQNALDLKADDGHTHPQSEVTGLVAALAGKQPAGSYATAAQGALADTAVQPADLTTKQDTLVSGTNIKTVNGSTLLGSGDLVISGGGSSATQVTLTVTPVALNYKEIVVVDATVSAVSKIEAYLVGELDTENDLESLSDDNMRVFAIAEAGQVRFVLTGNGAFVGPYKVNYKVGT